MFEDTKRCYRAVKTRDARFDGWFVTAVSPAGRYCRASCPLETAGHRNVRFFPTAAAAQVAGFAACERCRPDAAPGSPEWNVRPDIAGRAMRLIADGVIERAGVAGLAARLRCSEELLDRALRLAAGAGAVAIAAVQRERLARELLESRQSSGSDSNGWISLQLPFRGPLAADSLMEFLAVRAVPGVEEVLDGTYRRTMRLPHGPALVELTPRDGFVACRLRLTALVDVGPAVQRCRRLFDLDADPAAVADVLGQDEALGPVLAANPGRRAPGHVDGHELAVRAVLGQQVSVKGARTLAGRLVARHGELLAEPDGGLTHLFPGVGAIASSDPAELAMPVARQKALLGLCAALERGDVVIDPGASRPEMETQLVALRGIGPWTAGYIAMRALSDPDTFLPTDLGVLHAMAGLGLPSKPKAAAEFALRWQPWRSYALAHLWATLGTKPKAQEAP